MIPAIVLAAGKSTRMGRPKATLPLHDATFVGRIVQSFSHAGVDDVIVVVGCQAESIAEYLTREHPKVRVVVNPDYESGQFSSVLKGLAAADRPGVRALLLTLVDVPLVSAETIRRVIDRYRETGAPIVRPVRGNEHGHPVLIDRHLFDALRRADPAAGAKPIVRAHASAAGDVWIEDDGAYRDIDTPEDYERLVSTLGGAHT